MVSRLSAAAIHEINKRVTGNAAAAIIKGNELESALSRPGMLAYYQPTSTSGQRAATLAYGIIMGHPFLDGNKRTAHEAADQYLKDLGMKKLGENKGGVSAAVAAIEDAHTKVASQQMSLEELQALYEDLTK